MKTQLSKIQEQFWVLSQLYPDSSTYNIPLVYKLTGTINVDALKNAILKTIKKHSILASNILNHSNSIFLDLPDSPSIDDFFQIETIQNNSAGSGNIILNIVNEPFNLKNGKLTRIRYISFNDCSYLVMVFHHMIIDHHSKFIITSEISEHYSQLVNGKKSVENNPRTEYKEYVIWENEWLISEKAVKAKNEWSALLGSCSDQINLPFDFNGDITFKSQGKRLLFNIDGELGKSINDYSSKNSITPFVFLLSAFAVFLSRMEEQSVFAIGIPLSNRKEAEFKDTVGCFVNILPLIVDVREKPTFSEIVRHIRTELLKNHRRQELPFIELQALYNKNHKGHPFYVGFTFEEPVEFTLTGANVEWQTIERNGSQLELFLTLWPSVNGFQGFWEYNSEKFENKTIKHFIEIYTALIAEVLMSEDKPFTEYPILPYHDKLLIEEFNRTDQKYAHDVCIHQIFEQKALEFPNNIALIFKNKTLTYQELNESANLVANFLIRENIQIGDIVAVACERRMEMIIAILAILKSGGIYLPLQINNPPAIIEEITDFAKPKFILTSELGSKNIEHKENLIFVEDILNTSEKKETSNPVIKIAPNNVAYIIFTSGSTGIPKGVKIKHHSVVNRIVWMQKAYPLGVNDVLIQKTPVTFDVSVWELFWWYFAGARLLLPEQNAEKDPLRIIELIAKHNVSRIHFVPSMFVYFIDALEKFELTSKIKSLKTIFCSGESLSCSMVNTFYGLNSSYPLPQIVNLYGPTEATVDVSYYNCPAHVDEIFIGKPIHNTGLYVVNSDLNIQPVGVKGELIITGDNLALGYLYDQELTKQKFVPFLKPDGTTVLGYKTGDIVRLKGNSQIEFIGRKDNQVKIRGIRIELGEIEARISRHPNISDVAVNITNDKKNIQIISYVVPKNKSSINKKQMLNDFRAILSPQMIPSELVFIDKLPLTASGKLDRKNLPTPPKSILNKEYSGKETVYEKELTSIWQNVLRTNNIHVTDNFYDAGGNSLLAINLSMQIATKFMIEPDVISVLEYPTIRDYAAFLENKIKHELNESTPSETSSRNRAEILRSRFTRNRKN